MDGGKRRDHRPRLSTSPPSHSCVLARKEFWAKVRRGALLKAAAALVAGMAVGTLVGWGLLELFPELWRAPTGSSTR